MADKANELNEHVERNGRFKKIFEDAFEKRYSADPIQRALRQMQQSQNSLLKTSNQLSNPARASLGILKASHPVLTSLSILAASQSKRVEKEKKLLDRIDTLMKDLSKAKQEKSEKEALATELQTALAEYQKQGDIKYLLGKINGDAEEKIRNDSTFFKKFAAGESHDAFILSVDIRSSTELMLNARTPEEFATFITGLCDKLTALVIDNGGILDKFTGDGVLAFFPTFYSGADAGYRALLTATQAIDFFRDHYKAHRRCFRVVISDTGLGVGIDFGKVHFVNIGEALSIVGTPVVYACRFSSAPAGTIYVNQSVRDSLNEKYQENMIIEETTLEVKGSGPVVAYRVRLKGEVIKPVGLPWKESTNV